MILQTTIILYVDGLCGGFGKNTNKNYNRNRSGSRNGVITGTMDAMTVTQGYDYKMDFVVEVPSSLNLSVSTINDGNITVENVKVL